MTMTDMAISNAKYLTNQGKVAGISATIGGQELSIPLDPANRHYAEIMRQVEAGTLTIAPADEETNV